MSITEARARRALRHVDIPWNAEVDDPRESPWVVHDHRGVLGGLAASFAVGRRSRRQVEDFFADLGLGARRALGRGNPCDTTLYRLLAEQTPAGLRSAPRWSPMIATASGAMLAGVAEAEPSRTWFGRGSSATPRGPDVKAP